MILKHDQPGKEQSVAECNLPSRNFSEARRNGRRIELLKLAT